jgi:hypothetical protein
MTDQAGGLDDLFAFTEEPPATEELRPPGRKKSRAGWVLRNVLLIAGATVVTIAGLRSAGIGVSTVLVVCAFVALRLLMLAVGEVAPPSPPSRSGGRRLTESENEYNYRFGGGDMVRAAVRQWEHRLDWSHNDPDRFSSNLLPVLSELADERLRLRHGITRASDPRRARELLGEPMWRLLAEPRGRPPKQRELDDFVETLERL